MNTQGSRLFKLRKAKKLTQQQLADKIGVSKTSIVWWEYDKSIPKLENLNGLCKELDTTIDYILHGNAQQKNSLPLVKDALKKIEMLLSEGKIDTNDLEKLDLNLANFIHYTIDTVMAKKSPTEIDAQKTA